MTRPRPGWIPSLHSLVVSASLVTGCDAGAPTSASLPSAQDSGPLGADSGNVPDASSPQADASLPGDALPDNGLEASGGMDASSADDAEAATMQLTGLEGQRWEVPCGTPRENQEVCDNFPPGQMSCPAAGNYNLDKTVTFPGQPGTTYDVAVRIRGVVEPRAYTGGMSDGMHFYTGGMPFGAMGTEDYLFNVYSISVSSPKQIYYFNYDEGKAVGHYVFMIDHMKTIKIDGGATVRMVAFDVNCSSIRNCMVTGPNCMPYIVPGIPPAPQAFNGQYIQLDVLSVTPAL